MTRNKKQSQDLATPETASPAIAGPATPEQALQPAPNIKFVGRDVYDKAKRKILRVVDPVDRFSDGGNLVKLPPADFQKRRRLFYHEAAELIAATFPNLYKIVKPRS
jgi:hypothetical protein